VPRGKYTAPKLMSERGRFLEELTYENGSYRTRPGEISLLRKLFPSFFFYWKDVDIVFRASAKAKRSHYDTAEWAKSSLEVLRALEHVGVQIEITGIDNFTNLDCPCVFVANHMSTLETFVLPSIIAPFREVTFVVKQSLVDYPVFKYVMRSRDPVTVLRTNARTDLKAVLEGGTERLKAGKSIIIFPQTTRMVDLEPASFNTVGVKLAKKADVPVVAIALKTDAWGNGRYFKDFGKIDPSKRVFFAFGEPLLVKGRGAEEHEEIIKFITAKLKVWNEQEGITLGQTKTIEGC
jgi:1-acyl-sn-glycerol-3-phosphate acyltransferase